MIDPNEIVMEAGRLDDVEVGFCNSGGCIHPGRSLVGSVGRLHDHDLFIILSLTCSRSLIIQKAW